MDESGNRIKESRPAVDVHYPNRRLSGSEWACERIVVIPAERSDAETAMKEIKIALEWLIQNLNICVREYDGQSVYDLGYLRSPDYGREMDAVSE